MSMFTAAQRRSLERISGTYTNLTSEESDFTLSDVFSLGLLLNNAISASERQQKLVDYYKSAYTCVCGALKICHPEIFLVRLANRYKGEVWSDFSDFNSVWYPKWFENQLWLRAHLFSFTDDETQKLKPDFWGATSADGDLKKSMLAVRDSFAQIRIGTLALVFKIDQAIASLIGWQDINGSVSWKVLQEKFLYPVFKP